MTSRSFDPQKLHVEAFAKSGDTETGTWKLRSLERLSAMAHPDAPPSDEDVVDWHATGELRKVRGAGEQPWLHLGADTVIALQCQRCLGPVVTRVDIDDHFRFVHGEEAAEKEDVDSEEDVLAMPRSLDLHQLVEDELMLALPLVPRHDVCPAPLPVPDNADVPEDDEPVNPFAALAALKTKPPLQ
jgi:uncharacterized protein